MENGNILSIFILNVPFKVPSGWVKDFKHKHKIRGTRQSQDNTHCEQICITFKKHTAAVIPTYNLCDTRRPNKIWIPCANQGNIITQRGDNRSSSTIPIKITFLCCYYSNRLTTTYSVCLSTWNKSCIWSLQACEEVKTLSEEALQLKWAVDHVYIKNNATKMYTTVILVKCTLHTSRKLYAKVIELPNLHRC